MNSIKLGNLIGLVIFVSGAAALGGLIVMFWYMTFAALWNFVFGD